MEHKGRQRKSADGAEKVLKSKRMHIYVNEKTNQKVRDEAKRLGMSIGDYIVETVLHFDDTVSGIPKQLDTAILKLNTYIKENKISLRYGRRNTTMARPRTIERQPVTEGGEVRTEQLHLRVTQDAYDKILQKSKEYSMSISDYINFIVSNFDILDISNKVDDINRKLDAIQNQPKDN